MAVNGDRSGNEVVLFATESMIAASHTGSVVEPFLSLGKKNPLMSLDRKIQQINFAVIGEQCHLLAIRRECPRIQNCRKLLAEQRLLLIRVPDRNRPRIADRQQAVAVRRKLDFVDIILVTRQSFQRCRIVDIPDVDLAV